MSVTFAIDGGEYAPDALNFSNANAAAMLRLAGLPIVESGEARGEQLAAASRRLLLAVNSARTRGREVEPLVIERNLIDCGRSDDYVERRSAQLLAMFVQAQKLGRAVNWG